MSDRK
jgi:hypothetical protein